MASEGHGVSNAVRENVGDWVREHRTAISGPVSGYRMQVPTNWVRKARRKHTTGFEREYQCHGVPGVKLIVHSPPSDYSVDSYAITVNGRVVAGGKAQIVSDLAPGHVKAAVKKAKTEAAKPVFKALTAAELQQIQTKMAFGDGFASLEFER